MFAGGYGGNRIKCRIVHHDPVLGFGFGFGIRFGQTRMSAAIMPCTALCTVAGMPQQDAKIRLSCPAEGPRLLAMIAIRASLRHAQSDGVRVLLRRAQVQ
jgi:hypothetical protein